MNSTGTTTQQEQTVRSRRRTPTWEIARLFSVQGHWSEADDRTLDTNHLVEFTEGTLALLPMPPPFHQRIVHFLVSQLEIYVRQKVSVDETFSAGKAEREPPSE